jgi:hypothetical protein
VKEKRVVFVARDQSAKGLQPADGALDDPAFAVTAKRAAVLRGSAYAASAMRTDEFNAALGQALAEWIAIASAIVDQTVGDIRSDCLIELRLDQRYLSRTGTVYVDREWQAGSIDQEHELRTLAAFGGSDEITPFLAEANVPSAKPSC